MGAPHGRHRRAFVRHVSSAITIPTTTTVDRSFAYVIGCPSREDENATD